MRRKTLLYFDTAEKIRGYIVSEKLQPGAFLPPERALADEFGISVVTLKKALKFLCEENILTTVPRRGTRVNSISFNEGASVCRKRRIGLTVWENTDIFHTDTVSHIALSGSLFPAESYEIVMVYVNASMIYAGTWGNLLPSDLDGMLVTVQELPDAMLNELKTASLPAVFIEHENFSPGCWIDEAPGVFKLLNYLISMGHKKIAFVSGPAPLAMVQKQLRAFKSFAADKKLFHDERYIVSCAYERKSAFVETLRILELPSPPTAILLGSEFMAQGALDALQSKGLKCPDDVSIASFGGGVLSQQSYPQLTVLTTVFNQSPGLFSVGAQMLRNILEKGEAGASLIVERDLIVRESTALRHR
ncbi:MAG: hypothetical protein A2017_08840 [Lentisphaerae bacterium GWF2_44_16]|nr:MAG: hypothetical protein A2017_08840 [Lentisphaerae bacterium GWF2_44_16]